MPKLSSLGLVTLPLVGLLAWSTTSSPAAAPAQPTCPAGMKAIPGGVYKNKLLQKNDAVDAFCLDPTEVTVDAFAACVAAKKCAAPLPARDEPTKVEQFCNYQHPDKRGNHPVNCVDWDQAKAYCAFVGKRLPTQSEWVWAGSGGDKAFSYPWGEGKPAPTLVNGCGPECMGNTAKKLGKEPHPSQKPLYKESDGWPETAPVGSFKAGENPFGLLDMAGNVSEWNATPEKGSKTVRYGITGGSWMDTASESFYLMWENSLPQNARLPIVGFRCAR